MTTPAATGPAPALAPAASLRPRDGARDRRSRWDAELEREFEADVTALNLRRAKFAGVAGMMIALWASLLGFWVAELPIAPLRGWLATCVGIYVALLLVRQWVSRPGGSLAARGACVYAFVVALIGICDGFFFILSQPTASVSSFSRGMLVTGVLFVLPPGRFLPLVAVNELLLCAWLVWTGFDAFTFTALLDGTAGAVVASVASWMLYGARRADFLQQRQIRRQHADMDELMAITAHDLRSPLLGLKNLLGLAASRSGLDRVRLMQVVTDAARACDRLLELVNRLVHAHAAEQPSTATARRADLRPAVAASTERARSAAAAKNLRLQVRLPAGPAEACVDDSALGQVLDNLLGNAIKFSPPGTAIEVVLESSGRGWRCEIADEGPGVAPAERGRLFQKYARGTSVATGGEPGSGLGLFIVKTLLERMNATVSYAPREPRGARFIVDWPAP